MNDCASCSADTSPTVPQIHRHSQSALTVLDNSSLIPKPRFQPASSYRQTACIDDEPPRPDSYFTCRENRMKIMKTDEKKCLTADTLTVRARQCTEVSRCTCIRVCIFMCADWSCASAPRRAKYLSERCISSVLHLFCFVALWLLSSLSASSLPLNVHRYPLYSGIEIFPIAGIFFFVTLNIVLFFSSFSRQFIS